MLQCANVRFVSNGMLEIASKKTNKVYVKLGPIVYTQISVHY